MIESSEPNSSSAVNSSSVMNPASVPQYVINSGFDVLIPDVRIVLTDESKALYERSAPGTGFIFILELPDVAASEDPHVAKLHMFPAFNKDDGLIHGLDKEGKRFISLDAFTAPLGTIGGGIMHGQAASILGLGAKKEKGFLMGGGVWKAGAAIRFVEELPPREGRIPNDYLLTRDPIDHHWELHFVNRIPFSFHGGCNLSKIDIATIPGLQEAIDRLPNKKHMSEFTFAERQEITSILTSLPPPRTEISVKIQERPPSNQDECTEDVIYLQLMDDEWKITFGSSIANTYFSIYHLELPWRLQEALRQLPKSYKAEDFSSEAKAALSALFTEIFNEPLDNDGQVYGFKLYKNRSSALNTLAMHYTDLYRDFFAAMTQAHGAHALQLPREIPLPWFEKIVVSLCRELDLPPDTDLATNPKVPGGVIGPRPHLYCEKTWLKNSEKRIYHLVYGKQFEEALKNGDTQTIASLLKKGVNPNDIGRFYDKRGAQLTALRYAIENGPSEMVSCLLEAGANPNLMEFGNTPLSLAIEKRNISLINELIKYEADVNNPSYTLLIESDTPIYPLNMALLSGNINVINTLLNAGAIPDPESSPLYSAIYKGQLEIAKTLMEHGITTDKKCQEMLQVLEQPSSMPSFPHVDTRDDGKIILYDDSTQQSSLRYRIATALMSASSGKTQEEITSMCRSLIVHPSANWQGPFRNIVSYLGQYSNANTPPAVKDLCVKLLEMLSRVPVDNSNYEKIFEDYRLQNHVYLISKEDLVSELQTLLNSIQASAIGENDTKITAYCEENQNAITNNIENLEYLLTIKNELTKTLESVRSDEINMVKQSIADLSRDNFSFFGKDNKAGRIEAALQNTPLNERGTVLSTEHPGNEARVLQKELARHRLFPPGKVYKTATGEIDEEKAARTFKNLKQRLRDKAAPDKPNDDAGPSSSNKSRQS